VPTRGCAQLDRYIPGDRHHLSDRGNAAGDVHNCEAAVAHLSMWLKDANKRPADVDEGLVAEFVEHHLPAAIARRVLAIRAPYAPRWATCLSFYAPPTLSCLGRCT
jgi:hypothetical protein